MPVKQVKYSVSAFIPTAAGLAALFLPLAAPLRGLLALAWLLGSGDMLGGAVFPDERRGWRAFLGTLLFSSATITIGAAVYRLYGLDLLATFLVVSAVSWGAVAYAARAGGQRLPFGTGARTSGDAADYEQDDAPPSPFLGRIVGVAACIAALALLWYSVSLLAGAVVGGSIRSPWDAAPHAVFLLFFLAAAFVFIAAHGDISPGAAVLTASAAAAFVACVAVLVYKVGFGFDPFLHRATEQMIFTDGSVSPKPFYYLGQYAAVTIVARMLGGHVDIIDKSLVPVALALVVPVAYFSLRRAFGFVRGQAAAAALAVLALPLAAFASTTPQGFADALFLMTAFLALPASVGRFPLQALAVMAVAVAAIHPLAGVPLLLFVAILALALHAPARGRFAAAPYVLAVVGAAALPLVFLLNARLSGTGVTIDAQAAQDSASFLGAFQSAGTPTRRFDLFLDFVYGWKAFRATAIFAAAVAGLALLRKRGGAWLPWALGAFVCLGNFALLKTLVQFPFLIDYERSSYADRLFELALFMAAPAMCAAVAWTLERLRHGMPSARVFAAALAAAIITSSLYLAYPRRDQYEASRGWSTSASDVQTVRSIDADAAGKPYVVLANQSVSAAAVQELGFRRYYDSHDPSAPEPVFFYPIPTGGPLYARFLTMNDAHGSSAEAIKAMDLAGVDTAYYVVSYYWWDAQRITVNAKKNADRSWTVGGEDFVFKYVR